MKGCNNKKFAGITLKNYRCFSRRFENTLDQTTAKSKNLFNERKQNSMIYPNQDPVGLSFNSAKEDNCMITERSTEYIIVEMKYGVI